MLQLVRSNPGVLVSFILLGSGAVVCTLLGFIMTRSGASLRPILWFAGLFALVVVPQLIGHLYLALHVDKSETTRIQALENIANGRSQAVSQTRRSSADQAATGIQHSGAPVDAADARFLFGPDADPQLIMDARPMFGEVFTGAELAQFASLPGGETALIAQFKSYSAAERAWVNYLRVSGLSQLDGKGDSQRGYAVTRPIGDRAYVLHVGSMVGAWTGRDDATIRQRLAASGFDMPRGAPLSGTSPPLRAGGAVRSISVALAAALIALNLLVVTVYFFKGAAWAGTAGAKPGTVSVPVSELASRLEAINTLDVPIRIERGASSNELFATWRYADARWVDLARARGLKRTHRIRLALDEASGTVRATDHVASHEWSAGRGGATQQWKAGLGIVFFRYEHQRVLGLQLDEQGRFKADSSYAYTFNLEEMKSPLIEAVTRAGWNWRPTIWQGPAWLRGLTE